MDAVYVPAVIGGSFIAAERAVFGRLNRWRRAHPNLCLRDLSIDGANFDRSDYYPAD